MPPFVAIDFETADRGPDSACAIGLARVEGGRVVATAERLIRPPRTTFEFSWVHGITWNQVEREPLFGDVWPELRPLLEGVRFLAAHNAGFDRRVLQSCCQLAGLPAPDLPFRCTVQLARKTWGLPKNDLASLCKFLDIPLKHHDAGSDAVACARILLAARLAGADA